MRSMSVFHSFLYGRVSRDVFQLARRIPPIVVGLITTRRRGRDGSRAVGTVFVWSVIIISNAIILPPRCRRARPIKLVSDDYYYILATCCSGKRTNYTGRRVPAPLPRSRTSKSVSLENAPSGVKLVSQRLMRARACRLSGPVGLSAGHSRKRFVPIGNGGPVTGEKIHGNARKCARYTYTWRRGFVPVNDRRYSSI